MISLPMQWLRSISPEVKYVTIQMDSENKLIIVAGMTLQDTTGYNDTHGCEYQ